MKPFVVANLLDENTYDHICYRVVDLETMNTFEMNQEELEKLVMEEPNKYKDTNVYNLVMADEIDRDDLSNYIIDEEYSGKNIDGIDTKVALKKLKEGNVYLVSDRKGNIKTYTEEELDEYSFVNVFKTDDGDLIGLVNVAIEPQEHGDSEKEIEIKDKYDIFKNKCNLFNIDNSFEYKIDGDDVILVAYTGTSTNVTIPSFVTIIGENSFCAYKNRLINDNVKEITLNEGLKRINKYALGNTKIRNITIPSTVELIEKNAFYSSRLTDYNDELGKDVLNMERVTLLNPNTIIEE